MMMALKDPSMEPPGGFRFLCETGYDARGAGLAGVEKEATSHLQGNGLPVPDNFRAVIENQMCRRLADEGRDGWCKRVEPPPGSEPSPQLS